MFKYHFECILFIMKKKLTFIFLNYIRIFICSTTESGLLQSIMKYYYFKNFEKYGCFFKKKKQKKTNHIQMIAI